MRLPFNDKFCGYCLFEGRETMTFAYTGQIYWCPWHQANVPPVRDGKWAVPAGATEFPSELGRWR